MSAETFGKWGHARFYTTSAPKSLPPPLLVPPMRILEDNLVQLSQPDCWRQICTNCQSSDWQSWRRYVRLITPTRNHGHPTGATLEECPEREFRIHGLRAVRSEDRLLPGQLSGLRSDIKRWVAALIPNGSLDIIQQMSVTHTARKRQTVGGNNQKSGWHRRSARLW